jgi:AraC-like DNA-binding protein
MEEYRLSDAHGPIGIEPVEVHLAHYRPDVPGHASIAPRRNLNWQILFPLRRHRFYSAVGEHGCSGPCLYVIPNGLPYSVRMSGYAHYSVHFSNRDYRGHDATAAAVRDADHGNWPHNTLPADLVGLALGDATWTLVQPIHDAPEVVYLLHRLIERFSRGDRFGSRTALGELLYALTLTPGSQTLAGRIQPFADYLTLHINESPSVAELAGRCSMSPSRFLRAVREAYGYSPKEVILREKLALACQLLERGTPVGEVASACGFADRYYFSRVFRLHRGIPPSQWGGARAR